MLASLFRARARASLKMGTGPEESPQNLFAGNGKTPQSHGGTEKRREEPAWLPCAMVADSAALLLSDIGHRGRREHRVHLASKCQVGSLSVLVSPLCPIHLSSNHVPSSPPPLAQRPPKRGSNPAPKEETSSFLSVSVPLWQKAGKKQASNNAIEAGEPANASKNLWGFIKDRFNFLFDTCHKENWTCPHFHHFHEESRLGCVQGFLMLARLFRARARARARARWEAFES